MFNVKHDDGLETEKIKSSSRHKAESSEVSKEISLQIKNLQKELDERKYKMDFVANVINAKPEVNDAFQKYQRLLYNDYMKYANQNDSLAKEAQCLLALQKVENDLKFMTYDEALLNKTIVAVVGSFSSGKSSFINSFFVSKKIVLPIAMDQTTAISSYVMNGSELDITGFSYSGGRVQVPENIFTLFRYGKIEAFNLNIKKIIHHIVVKNRFVRDFDNLCFIDTPGFEAAHETESDYAAAASAVTNANAVLWCFNCDAGTFKDDELHELAIIPEQNPDLKIYIVANKADLKPSDECEQILDTSYKLLIDKGIKFEGFGLYSAKNKFTEQDVYASRYRGMSLNEFLKDCNVPNTNKVEKIVDKIQKVFDAYIAADKKRIEHNKSFIRTLATIENNFRKIKGNVENARNYYKARFDKKRYEAFDSQYDDEKNESELADISSEISKLKQELNVMIKNDSSDINQASDLCEKMQKVATEVFNVPLSHIARRSNSFSLNSEKISEPHFCINCGNHLKANQRFCQKCGMEVL